MRNITQRLTLSSFIPIKTHFIIFHSDKDSLYHLLFRSSTEWQSFTFSFASWIIKIAQILWRGNRSDYIYIEWFGSMEEKTRHSFISFDIVDFYPSISESLLDQALSWASNLADISDEDISIIKHARKSPLFNHGRPWIKNNNSNLFDVTMGSYDGAEICELVGLFILNHLGKKFGKKNIGLYRW